MHHLLRTRRIAACLVFGALLALALPAHAAPVRPSHVYAQLGIGPGYVTNFTREPMSGYAGNEHTAAGVAVQFDLGARLLRLLSLHTTQVLDVGAPERSGLTPLYRFGLGLGATLHVQGAQLTVAGGAHLTWYMNYVDDPSVPMGADIGPFVAASLGYVFAFGSGLALGIHGTGRYYSATDEFMGTRYDPYGYTFGALVSVGFLGKPFLGP